MSEETSAVATISPAPGDYDSICAALMQTGRGRWFLQEYARRSRGADTQLLLAAIARIEAAVCVEKHAQVPQDFRSDLLDMAEAITRTRAEVAEPASEASPAPRSPQPRDVFAAAGRIRDVTWAMRGHGFDPGTCDQLEELAASILSASSLRDPADHRARKLSEVLQYLEFRIDALLGSCADGGAPAPAPTNGAAHRNGSANAFVTQQREHDAADAPAGRELPLSPQIRFHSAPLAIRDDVEGDAAAQSPPDAEIGEPGRPPNEGRESALEPPVSPRNQEVAAHTADATATRSASPIDGARAGPPDAFLPALELAGSTPRWRESPAAQAASAAERETAARLLLPELEIRPPGRAQPAELLTAQLAVAPMPRPADGDPLAELKAMSDNELIALFS
jgi:hypothetical protein